MVSVEASFLAPLRHGDVIAAHITFSNIGTSSLGQRYRPSTIRLVKRLGPPSSNHGLRQRWTRWNR